MSLTTYKVHGKGLTITPSRRMIHVMKYTKRIVNNINLLAFQAGATQELLGALWGVKKGQANRILNGHVNLNAEQIGDVAELFDVPFETLCGEEERFMGWLAANPRRSINPAKLEQMVPDVVRDKAKHRSGWHVRTGPNALGRLTHFLHLADEPAQMIDLR